MKPVLLGLTGLRGSGKDTAFGFIREWAEGRGLTAQRRSLADKLKHSAARSLGFDRLEENDAIVLMNELKEFGEITTYIPSQSIAFTIEGRQFLQFYGTEGHRDVFGGDFWADALLPKSEISFSQEIWPDRRPEPDWWDNFANADICGICDVRFPNEGKRVKELGGQIWQIHRPGMEQDGHSSEAGLPPEMIDLVITNNGTMDEFQDAVNRSCDRFLGREQ